MNQFWVVFEPKISNMLLHIFGSKCPTVRLDHSRLYVRRSSILQLKIIVVFCILFSSPVSTSLFIRVHSGNEEQDVNRVEISLASSLPLSHFQSVIIPRSFCKENENECALLAITVLSKNLKKVPILSELHCACTTKIKTNIFFL